MNNKTYQHQTLRDQGYEKELDAKKSNMRVQVETLAKDHASQNTPNSVDELSSLAIGFIEKLVQSPINFNQQHFQPLTLNANWKDTETSTNLKIERIDADTKHLTGEQQILKNKLTQAAALLRKKRLLKVLMVALVVMAVADSLLNIVSFRYYRISTIGSYFGASSIAICIVFGVHQLGKYINKATSINKRIVRMVIAIAPYIVGFTVLGYMRLGYLSEGNRGGTGLASTLCITALSILSVLLALYLTSHWVLTSQEVKEYDSLQNAKTKLKEVVKQLEDLGKERAQLERELREYSDYVRSLLEYALSIEQSLVDFADELLDVYKRVNLNYRKFTVIPPCFLSRAFFQFNRFYNSFKRI